MLVLRCRRTGRDVVMHAHGLTCRCAAAWAFLFLISEKVASHEMRVAKNQGPLYRPQRVELLKKDSQFVEEAK